MWCSFFLLKPASLWNYITSNRGNKERVKPVKCDIIIIIIIKSISITHGLLLHSIESPLRKKTRTYEEPKWAQWNLAIARPISSKAQGIHRRGQAMMIMTLMLMQPFLLPPLRASTPLYGWVIYSSKGAPSPGIFMGVTLAFIPRLLSIDRPPGTFQA